MNLETLLLAALAVWRLTHLLQAEDGPWDLGVRLRQAAGAGFWGRLLDCFYCLSLWVALPIALLTAQNWREGILLWLGLSGAAILLERLTARPQAALYQEDENALLQRETTTAQPEPGPPPT